MSFEELNVPENHIYLFKPHASLGIGLSVREVKGMV